MFMISNYIARFWMLAIFCYWGINIFLLKTNGETICKKNFGVKIVKENYEKAPFNENFVLPLFIIPHPFLCYRDFCFWIGLFWSFARKLFLCDLL